jgi:hypothetical protein
MDPGGGQGLEQGDGCGGASPTRALLPWRFSEMKTI